MFRTRGYVCVRSANLVRPTTRGSVMDGYDAWAGVGSPTAAIAHGARIFKYQALS